MAWCVECWSQDRRTESATKVLDAEDLCDLHYRKALGEGLPAVPKNVPPMPAALGTGMPAAPKNAAPEPPNSKAVDIRLPPPVTVATASIPAATTAGEVRPKEKESMANKQRLCACRPGCTEIAKSNASPYAKGHNPDAKKKATPAPHNGKDKRSAAIRGGQQSNGGGTPVHIPLTVTVPLRGEHLDALWGRLSLQEKADKLFPAE